MAIVGGAILPPMQGLLTDHWGDGPAQIVPGFAFLCVLGYAIDDLRQPVRILDEGETPAAFRGGH